MEKTEDDKLLERAKRFVEEQERKRDNRDRDHHRDDRKHHKRGESRGKGKDRHRHEDDSGRKKRDRDRRRSRSRSRSRDRDRDRDRDRKHKRHRLDDDEKRDKHDRHNKHKKRRRDEKKDRKKEKKKHSSKDEDHDRKKPAKVDVKKLVPLGPMAASPPSDLIDAEADYFAFHQHFRLFLYRSSGIFFEDLSSEDSHKEFASFASQYNAGKLEAAYYNAKLPPEAMEQCKRTQHKWAFKTNATEQQSLELVRAGVKKQTEWSSDAPGKPAAAAKPMICLPVSGPTVSQRNDANFRDDGRRRKSPEELAADRTANRRLREHVKATHEELTGGRADYGRERQLEKRREKSEKLHGSAKDREAEAMGGPDLDDEALYGGGRAGRGESFQEALAREKARKAKREQKKSERIGELQKKEDDKAKAMLDMLGLSGIKPGQKITIAPRKD